MKATEMNNALIVARKQEHRCPVCGAPRIRGSEYCDKHRKVKNINRYMRDRYRRKREERKCVVCDSPTDGHARCLRCRMKINERKWSYA